MRIFVSIVCKRSKITKEPGQVVTAMFAMETNNLLKFVRRRTAAKIAILLIIHLYYDNLD